MATTTGLGIRYGDGKNIHSTKSTEDLVKVSLYVQRCVPKLMKPDKVYISDVIVYSFTVICTKLSILYLYHRIFQSRTLVYVASLIGVLVLAYSIALIIFAFLKCVPSSKIWSTKPEGTWVPTRPAYIALA